MLDRVKHEIILKKILIDIYNNKLFQNKLVFKGGTCLYFFHGLNRFSTDLDFNILTEEFDEQSFTELIANYISIDEGLKKHYTYFWIGSYETGKQKIKIEINNRKWPDSYQNQNLYGLSVPCLDTGSMFAHKLCAILDRKRLQNRDLYDSWFMFNNNFPLKEEIITLRTGKSVKDYFKELISFLENNRIKTSVLDGLGEVLDEKHKVWVKHNLYDKLLIELKLRS